MQKFKVRAKLMVLATQILLSTSGLYVRASKHEHDALDQCRAQSEGFDLPRTVLPACSEWRIAEVCSDFSGWKRSFSAMAFDNSAAPIFSVQAIFRHYLQSRNSTWESGDEELRRFMQVVDTDAHIKLDDCGECLMQWTDFHALMWGYTTRVLGPAQRAPKYREMVLELVGGDSDLMSSASAVASLLRDEQHAYLMGAPAASRRLLTAAAMFLMSADDRAALIQAGPPARTHSHTQIQLHYHK
jgi:hypothetical protein